MATRVERCRWCRARLVVPQDTLTINCSRCGVVVNLPPATNRNLPHSASSLGNVVGGGNAALRNAIRGGVSFGVQRAQTFIRSRIAEAAANTYGPKRAVLCGVSYKGHPKELKGSINDVMSMKKLLTDCLGFPHAAILILTEDEKDPSRIPTKINIRRALNWLVQGCQPGDSLVFHYSGHGSKVKDVHGDEIDGHDECLCPVDYETEGRILDDELNASIVRPLSNGVTLHAVIDTCFSGTFLDLPYMCKVNRDGYYRWEDHRMADSSYDKVTKGGLAICISACDDHQTSGDTTAFNGMPNGALTYSLVQTLQREARLTYGQLLVTMRNKIFHGQRAAGNWGPIQEPQLSCTESFDIHLKKITL